MEAVLNPFALVLIATSAGLMIIGLFIFGRKNIKGSAYFANLLFVAAFWAFCSAHETTAYGPEVKIFFSQLSYIGIVFTGYFWLLFCLSFVQASTKTINILKYVLLVPAVLVLAAVFTNGMHYAIWANTYQSIPTSGYSPVVYVHGWLFYVNSAIIYAEVILGVLFLTKYGLKQHDHVRLQVLYVILAMIIPLVFSVLYVIFSKQVDGYDPTPFGLLFTAVIIAYTVYKRNFLEFLPTAKETIYQTLMSGIVIVDTNMVVIDMNPMARSIVHEDIRIGTDLTTLNSTNDERLNKMKQLLLDKSKDAVFYCKRLNKWIEVGKYDLKIPDQKSEGTLYFFYDITAQREILEQLKQSESLLSSIISFLPDPTFVIDKKGKVVIWNKAMEVMTQIQADKIVGKGDFAYSLPLYGKRRPMLIDVVLNPLSDYISMYKEITRKDDTLSAVVSRDDLSLWCIAKPLYDNNGNKIGAIESLRNISEQKKTEAELQDRLDTLLKLNDIMIKRESRLADLTEELQKQKEINEKD